MSAPVPDLEIQAAARLLAEGRPDDAARRLEALVAAAPAYAAAIVLLARAYEGEGRAATALAAWHRAHFLVPTSPLVQRERQRLLDAQALAGAPPPPDEPAGFRAAAPVAATDAAAVDPWEEDVDEDLLTEALLAEAAGAPSEAGDDAWAWEEVEVEGGEVATDATPNPAALGDAAALVDPDALAGAEAPDADDVIDVAIGENVMLGEGVVLGADVHGETSEEAQAADELTFEDEPEGARSERAAFDEVHAVEASPVTPESAVDLFMWARPPTPENEAQIEPAEWPARDAAGHAAEDSFGAEDAFGAEDVFPDRSGGEPDDAVGLEEWEPGVFDEEPASGWPAEPPEPDTDALTHEPAYADHEAGPEAGEGWPGADDEAGWTLIGETDDPAPDAGGSEADVAPPAAFGVRPDWLVVRQPVDELEEIVDAKAEAAEGAGWEAEPEAVEVFELEEVEPEQVEPRTGEWEEREPEDGAPDDLDALIRQLEGAPRLRPDPHFVPPAEPGEEPEEIDDDLVSETLARIYAAQHQYAEAAVIYEKLARQRPAEAADLLRKAAELRARGSEPGDA